MVMEKQKAMLLPHQTLNICSFPRKRRKKRVEEEEIEEMEVALWFGQGGEVVFVICGKEGVKGVFI